MSTLPMYRIDAPTWARAPECWIDEGFGDENARNALAQRATLLALVQRHVQDYIDDPRLTFEDDFPNRWRLSGAYYIAREDYGSAEAMDSTESAHDRYRASIMVRCLERPERAGQADLDYLGLEVHFIWSAQASAFAFTGEIDSSVI